jgi:[ribosomal protein S5]-alanine N-acetyltransferase
MGSAVDAEFVLELLNSPGFLRYIGDRGVRDLPAAREFIEKRYRQSYRDHGFGLYTVELKAGSIPVGMCGFVKREGLPNPDLGFAFLPRFEKNGYGFESAAAVMKYGRETLKFDEIMAITTLDNDASGRLLAKVGFKFDKRFEMPDGEVLNLYSSKAPEAA